MGVCGSKTDPGGDASKAPTNEQGGAGGAGAAGRNGELVAKKRAADHYTMLKLLGSGASCQVHEVQRKDSQEMFAMKVLEKKQPDNKTLFESEVKIMSALSHPNIVEFVEAFEDKNSWNIITRLCLGGELFDRVLAGKFSERNASQLTRQMLEAIKECHDKGVVHRDLKPENFVFADGGNDAMKLIDFGCAVKVKDDDIVMDVAGSPYYVAPEVLHLTYTRTGAVWKASDMWSIGVIVYLLLHGYPPFNGNSQPAIFSRIKRGRYRFAPPGQIPMSDSVKSFIKQLLVLDPTKRLTVDQALRHPWVADAQSVSDTPLGEQVGQSLKAFVNSCRLQKAVCKMLSRNLSDKDREALSLMFEKYDTNGDGKLDADEIAHMLKDIGHQSDAKDFIKLLDEDDDGVVDQEEFKVVFGIINQPDDDEKLADLFQQFDKDKSGKLDQDEIAQLLKVTGEEARLILAEVDADGDNEVSFDEFIAAMTSNRGVNRVMTGKKNDHPHAVPPS